MAKIGCLKPFRGSYSNMKDIVLEDGEIAFTIGNTKRIYFGNGTDKVEKLTPFADISKIPISISGGVSWIANKTIWENIVDSYGNLIPGTTFALDGWNAEKASDSPFDNGWLMINGILIGYQSDNFDYPQGYMIVRGTIGGVYKICMCDMAGIQGKIWINLS